MKKILFAVIAIVTLFALVSCSKTPVDDTVTPDDIVEFGEYDPRFDSTVEEVADCYFSLLTDDGFGNYLLAFPEEFRVGYQNELGYDDATFQEAIDNATYTLHVNRDEKYMGYDFRIEYKHIGEEEITGEKKESLINDLVTYCYMTRGSIEKVVEHTYDVSTYGFDPVNEEVYMQEQENKKLTMLYIKEDGWYVSPTNFELP